MIKDYLQKIASLPDDSVDLAAVALMLASGDQKEVSLDRYRHHLEKLGQALIDTHQSFLNQGREDTLDLRLEAIKSVFVEQFDYHGDQDTFDDLQNSNLMRVIDRRKGSPIALCILCIHMMRKAGWQAYGLHMPGHFLCRLDKDGVRVIFDPFYSCHKMEARDLRALIKEKRGQSAELSADFYKPVPNREILIRLQNTIKHRQIEHEEYDQALQTVEIMRLIDADEYRLLLDAGVLYARVGQPRAAIDVLEDYIKLAPNDRDRYEASMLLHDLKSSLN